MSEFWLVRVPDQCNIVMPDDVFVDWADRVKYEGFEYEASPFDTLAECLELTTREAFRNG